MSGDGISKLYPEIVHMYVEPRWVDEAGCWCCGQLRPVKWSITVVLLGRNVHIKLCGPCAVVAKLIKEENDNANVS